MKGRTNAQMEEKGDDPTIPAEATLTLREVAAQYEVSIPTLKRQLSYGQLTGVKESHGRARAWRLRRGDLEAAGYRRRVPAEPEDNAAREDVQKQLARLMVEVKALREDLAQLQGTLRAVQSTTNRIAQEFNERGCTIPAAEQP